MHIVVERILKYFNLLIYVEITERKREGKENMKKYMYQERKRKEFNKNKNKIKFFVCILIIH